MKKIKKLSDKELLENIHKLRRKEQEILNEVLENLLEIFDRRLFAERGFSSLFAFMVDELSYSKGAASRRIAALKLVQKVPLVKQKIKDGSLSLSVLSDTQKICGSLPAAKILKIIPKIENKTAKDAEGILLEFGTNTKRVDREISRRISKTEQRLTVNLNDQTIILLNKLKVISGLSTDKLLFKALSKELEEIKVKMRQTRRSRGTKGRNIPTALRNEVLVRANFQCQFPGCHEINNLEIEHIVPYAKGGKHSLENLLLYCRAHNQRAAIKEFGNHKMKKYLI